jgi:hypothetical protein
MIGMAGLSSRRAIFAFLPFLRFIKYLHWRESRLQ